MCLGTNRRPVLPPTAEDSHNYVSSKHHIIDLSDTEDDYVSSKHHIIDLSDTEDDDEIRILNFVPRNISFGKRKRNDGVEKGESSKRNDTPFICEICTDTKTTNDAFFISGCSHAYCVDCVAMYVGSKLQENVINIRCPVPGCGGLLEAEDCRSILPAEVFDRWGKASCEAVIEASDKFYCPYGDCSAMMIDDGTDEATESQCLNCGRMFCLQCKVPWHEGIKCEEFQRLNVDEKEKEGIMLMKLANEMKWKRCPNCKIYIERIEGCSRIRCTRCGLMFCHECGDVYCKNPNWPILPRSSIRRVTKKKKSIGRVKNKSKDI